MLSLMRSANLADWPFVGGNEPGVGSNTGLGLGRSTCLTMRYFRIAGIGEPRPFGDRA